MYAASWFEAFAGRDEAGSSLEVQSILWLCPPEVFPHLLEIGCGTGRVAGPLAEAGYRVVGIDINEEALQFAAERAPGPSYVCLDQRDVGVLMGPFDAAVVLWNSLGFRTRDDDQTMLASVRTILRPGGKLLLDLYHPLWLAVQPDESVTTDGIAVRRWVENGRCLHEIRYPNGHVDHIVFNVYLPDEMRFMLERAGFRVESAMAWWDATRPPMGRRPGISSRASAPDGLSLTLNSHEFFNATVASPHSEMLRGRFHRTDGTRRIGSADVRSRAAEILRR